MFGLGAGSFNPSDNVPDMGDTVASGGSPVLSTPNLALLNIISQQATAVRSRLNENSESTSSVTFGVVEVNDRFRRVLVQVADDVEEELTHCNERIHELGDSVGILRTQIQVVSKSINQEGESFSEILTTDSPLDPVSEENVSSIEETNRLKGTQKDCCFFIECIRVKLRKFLENCRLLWAAIQRVFSSLNTLVKLGVCSEEFRDSMTIRFAFLSDHVFLGLMTQFGFRLKNFDAHSSTQSFFPVLVPEENFVPEKAEAERVLDSGIELCRRIMSSRLSDTFKIRLLDDLKERLNNFVVGRDFLASAFEESFATVVGNLTGVLQASQDNSHITGDD